MAWVCAIPPSPWIKLAVCQISRYPTRWLSPRPVRIPVTSFSERSPQDRCNYWFSVPEGMALQGLFVPPGHLDPEGRVFVVTVTLDVAMGYSLQPIYPLPEGGMPAVHDRWPRLVELDLPR